MKRTMANQAFDLSILQEVAWETSKPSSKAQRLGNGVTLLQVTKQRAWGVDWPDPDPPIGPGRVRFVSRAVARANH